MGFDGGAIAFFLKSCLRQLRQLCHADCAAHVTFAHIQGSIWLARRTVKFVLLVWADLFLPV
jgi:hypothetical protein